MSVLPKPLDFADARLLPGAEAGPPSLAAKRKGGDRELSALMRAAQCGDQAAYTRLVREVMPLLRRVLRTRQRLLQSADRDDLMQEVLLSLHRAMATYDPGREFVPWLMAIARNKMADHARRFARSSANEVLVDDLDVIGAAAEPHGSETETCGDADALREAIGRLSVRQRKAIELVKMRELSSKEASQVIGTSPGALQSLDSSGDEDTARFARYRGRGEQSRRGWLVARRGPPLRVRLAAHSPRLSRRKSSDISNQGRIPPSSSHKPGDPRPNFREERTP